MVLSCPNKSHPDWKAIVEKYDERVAYAAYIANGEEIPPLSFVDERADIFSPGIFNKLTRGGGQAINDKTRARMIREVIETHLQKMGIGVGVLDNVEKESGVNGVYDPTVQRRVGDNLVEVIRVAEGAAGNAAIPEEYAHVVVDSIKDRALYTRLYRLLQGNRELLEAIFEREEAGSYQRYATIYNNDEDSLVREAMGKLVARHFLQQVEIDTGQQESYLLEKFLSDARSTWSSVPSSELSSALSAVDDFFHSFVREMLGGNVELEFTTGNPRDKRKLFQLEKQLDRSRKLLDELLQREALRFKIKRNPGNEKTLPADRQSLVKAKELHDAGKYLEGIHEILHSIINEMKSIQSKIEATREFYRTGAEPLRDTSRLLRNMKDFLDAYGEILPEISSYLLSDEYKSLLSGTNEALSLETVVKEIFFEKSKIETQYKNLALPLASKFLANYLGSLEGKTFNGEIITEDTIARWLLESTGDIGFLNRWVTAMTESSDTLLRLMAEPVQVARFRARNREISFVRILEKAQERLEKEEGNGDTSFMYETYNHTDPVTGETRRKLSGRYITRVNTGQYLHDLENEKRRIMKKFNIEGENARDPRSWPDAAREELSLFTSTHARRVGNKLVPDEVMYRNEAFYQMSPARKAYYKEITTLKRSLDALLPYSGSRTFMPQVRKDWYQRVKSTRETGKPGKMILSGLADKWIIREDDQDYYSENDQEMLVGFDNRPVDRLPMPFRRLLNDMDMLSTDATSAMIQYATMAINHDEMNKIVDTLEVIRDLFHERKVFEKKRDGKRDTREANYHGIPINQHVLSRKKSSHALDRLNDFFTMQVYGRYHDKEINIPLGKKASVNTGKLVDNLMEMTAMNTYALNMLSGISNVITGNMMARIDAIAGEFFGYKDLVAADGIYARNLGDILADTGRRRPRTKISLMLERFNLLQDREQALQNVRANRKNLFTRLLKLSSLFFLQNCGEHYMQARTFLALAHRVKLKDARGKEITFWDAFEVKINKEGVEEVGLKEGVTHLDGNALTERDFYYMEQKSKRVNQKLHGIYNREDRSAFQRLSIGRMVFMYRKWMVPAYNRRYQKRNWSFQLDQEEEGFYRTTWRFLVNLVKEHDGLKLHVATNYKKLSSFEKANIRRALTEIAEFMAVYICYMFLMHDAGPDDDDDYAYNLLKYQVSRLKVEMASYTPTPEAISGLMTIGQSIPTIDYITRLSRALFSVSAYWGDPLQSGPYKGYRPWVRNWSTVLPLHRPISRAMNPAEATRFFMYNRKG